MGGRAGVLPCAPLPNRLLCRLLCRLPCCCLLAPHMTSTYCHCTATNADTNAAIVGGMLGALHSASGIPAALRAKVESYVWKDGARQPGSLLPPGASCVRPEKLWGRQLAPLAERLFEGAVQDTSEAVAAQQGADVAAEQAAG